MIEFPEDALVASPYEYALNRTVMRALKQATQFYNGGSGVIVLVAPAAHKLTDYADVLEGVVSCQVGDSQRSDGGVMFVSAGDSVSKIQNLFDKAFQRNRRIIILVEIEHNLPALVMVTADAVINLDPIDVEDLREACKATLGLKVTLKEARSLLRFPSALLWAALRPDRKVSEIVQRLSSLSQKDRPSEVQPLTAMHGYGPAKQWGLELANDLSDWRNGRIPWHDVDKGIVLSAAGSR